MILRECAVPPVIVNVFAIDEYATFAVVEYLQVAASFVANEIVADGVPVVNVPEGNPPLRTGEVMSPESGGGDGGGSGGVMSED